MNNEFLEFFNQKFTKILYIGRFFVEKEDGTGDVQYHDIFKKRQEYFDIITDVPFLTLKPVVSEESGFFEKEQLNKIKKKYAMHVNALIIVEENTDELLLTDYFKIESKDMDMVFTDKFFSIDKKELSEEEFNNLII